MNERRLENEVVESSNIPEIDILGVLGLLLSHAWMIIIAMIVCGAVAFTGAKLTITPMYTASALLYVNNGSASIGGVPISISSSQLTAARSLLDTYVVILKTRTTLEAAIEKANLEEKYTYSQLASMVSASSVNDTDIFRIKATCADRDDALLIVDTLVEVLPDRISDIVDGSSVRVVDRAVRPGGRSSPSYTRYGTMGALAGAVICAAFIVVQDLMNNTVRDEEYLKARYNVPILAVIPEAFKSSGKKYKYRYRYGYKSRYRYANYRRYQSYVGSYASDYARNYEKAHKKKGDNK